MKSQFRLNPTPQPRLKATKKWLGIAMLAGLLAMVLFQPFSSSSPAFPQPTLVYLEAFATRSVRSAGEQEIWQACKDTLQSLQRLKTLSPEQSAELVRWQQINRLLHELEDIHLRLELQQVSGNESVAYQDRQSNLRLQLSQLYAAHP